MSNSPWGANTQFFYELTPDVIDEAIVQIGLRPTGRVVALNSLENRVYDIEVHGLKDVVAPYSDESIVAKFYRPGRWTEAQLREEHRFLNELKEYEIPVVIPMEINGTTLHKHERTGLFYTIFPRVRARLKDELNKSEIEQIGRLLGRLHNIGRLGEFVHRPKFVPAIYLKSNLEELKNSEIIPSGLRENYQLLGTQIFNLITPFFEHLKFSRIHGDFHRGNILWTSNDGPFITDLDDCVMGPAAQDLWLLLPGRDPESMEENRNFLEAYHQMSREEVVLPRYLIEAFRAMRLIHFNAWIHKRYEDPTFKQAFYQFNTQNYWEQQLLDLKEQIALIQDYLNY
jgi:Ser/Thr protein kinase RdoA (MazF antagonist)